jgi:hypothetical protein
LERRTAADVTAAIKEHAAAIIYSRRCPIRPP